MSNMFYTNEGEKNLSSRFLSESAKQLIIITVLVFLWKGKKPLFWLIIFCLTMKFTILILNITLLKPEIISASSYHRTLCSVTQNSATQSLEQYCE